MRNLKKILSLALALVMVFSLMTFASAQDFSDAADIEYSEAVEVLTALEVIDGVGNNTFNPNGKVTRAQMAKMITIISLGNVSVDAFKGTTTDLTDINGHWAEAYIKYCYSQGIISGKGSGRFDPDANVTTVEAAKMLLVALGYNSSVQVYEGPQWNVNVIRDASINDIFEDMGGGLASDLQISRDQAAQMMYNTLTTGIIEKGSAVDREDGGITDTYYKSESKTLLGQSFKGQIWVGDFTGNYQTGANGALKGEIQVNGKLETAGSGTGNRNANFPYDFDIDYIGEEVKVIFKDGTSGTKDQPDKNDTIYGVYLSGATQVVRSTRGDVKNQKDDNDKINVGGTKYEVTPYRAAGTDSDGNSYPASGTQVITNYRSTSLYQTAKDTYTNSKGEVTGNSQLTEMLKANNGDAIKLVLDPDTGKVTRVYVTTSTLAAVTAVNSEKVTMNKGVGSVELDGNDVYSGIAKGDIVVVTTLYKSPASEDDAYTIIKPAEVVSGTVTGYKVKTAGTSSETVSLDGKSYKVHNQAALLESIPDETNNVTYFQDVDVGDNFDLYMINGYVGAAIRTSGVANNYSIVTAVKTNGAAGSTFDALQLEVMDAEGTKKIITVSDDSTKKTSGDYDVGDIVVYTGSDSNALVTIKAEFSSAVTTYGYAEKTRTFGGTPVAANCVLFVETSSNSVTKSSLKTGAGLKFKAYDIRSLDSIVSGNNAVRVIHDGKVVAAFIDLTGTPGGASSNTAYGIVTGSGERTKDGDEYYYKYTVGNQDGNTTILVKGESAHLKKGDLVTFDISNDGTYAQVDVKVIDGSARGQAVYVKEYSESDGTISYWQTKSAIGDSAKLVVRHVKDDCKIAYVDADGDKGGSDIGINMYDEIKVYLNAAIITESTADGVVVKAILVESSGKCDILGASSVLPEDATPSDIQDKLSETGSVTLPNGIPEGTYENPKLDEEGNALPAKVTVTGGEITGNATVAGEVNIDGDVDIGASGTLSAQEITVKAGNTFTVADGATLEAVIMNIESGAKVQWGSGIVYTYKKDFVIDFLNRTTIVDGYTLNFKTANPSDPSTNGFLGAMYAQDAEGKDAGDYGWFTQKAVS